MDISFIFLKMLINITREFSLVLFSSKFAGWKNSISWHECHLEFHLLHWKICFHYDARSPTFNFWKEHWRKMFRFNDFSTFTNLIIKNLSPTLFYVFKGDLKRSDQVAIRMDLLRRQKLRGKIWSIKTANSLFK